MQNTKGIIFMKKKILIGSLSIIVISIFCYAIVYMMVAKNVNKENEVNSKDNYISPYDESIQGTWEAETLIYEGNELDTNGKTITFNDFQMTYEEDGVVVEDKSGKYNWIEEKSMLIVSPAGDKRNWNLSQGENGKLVIEDLTVNAKWTLTRKCQE